MLWLNCGQNKLEIRREAFKEKYKKLKELKGHEVETNDAKKFLYSY